MADYRLTRSIPSCRVDRDLLKEIEEYLTKRSVKYINPEEHNAPICEIRFEEGRGRTGTYQGVREVPRGRFDDSVRQVSLGMEFPTDYAPTSSSASITFDVSRSGSKLDISLSGQEPREEVIAIDAELQRLLDGKKTWNWLFHPDVLVAIPGMVVAILPAVMFLQLQTVTLPGYLLLVPLFLGVIYAICSSLRPFSRFDTRRNDTKDTLFGWLWKGIVGLGTVVGGIFARKWF